MTQREMHESFLAQIHNFDIDSEYEFQTHELNIFFTKAYREIVDELYANFEKDERTRKLLNKLVYTATLGAPAISTSFTNAYSFDLSTVSPDILYILNEEIVIGNTDPPTKLLVKVVTLDSYTANKENPVIVRFV